MDIEKYKRILSVNGLGHRERQTNIAKDSIIRQAHESPSYFEVELSDGVKNNKIKVLIINTSKTNVKKIVSIPIDNNDFFAGNIIDWKNRKWLITEIESNDDICISGLMMYCNYELKWQNEKLDILEYPVIVESNSGATLENSLINIGNNQLKVYIKYDKNTKEIYRGKRFFIDRNKVNPKPYKVINIDNVRNVYEENGYITLIMEEDVVINDKDNIEFFICNYKEHVDDQIQSNKLSEIIYNDNILVCNSGDKLVFDFKFIDHGNVVDDLIPLWSVYSINNEKLVIEENDNKLYLSCDDYSMIGENVKIELSCREDNGYSKCELIINVISMF